MNTPPATHPDPLARLLATINRNAQDRRRHHEDRKLAALRRRPWWMDEQEPEPDNHEPEPQTL